MRLILASASPRRRDLLTEIGVNFEVVPADIDETWSSEESPEEGVVRLATEKAQSIAQRFPDALVLGADTVVAVGSEVLGKPVDNDDALRMVRKLHDAVTHKVLGGVSVCCASKGIVESFCSETVVTFQAPALELLERYAATEEPLDKAGAYAIQGGAQIFVPCIEGSYSNVVGLDTARCFALFRKHGLDGIAG